MAGGLEERRKLFLSFSGQAFDGEAGAPIGDHDVEFPAPAVRGQICVSGFRAVRIGERWQLGKIVLHPMT